MLVIAVTSGLSTFVLSSRPPRPVSTTASLDLLLGEPLERDGRQDVEVGRGRLAFQHDRLDQPDQPGEVGLRDHLPVDLDPLADVGQVRAGVQPDLVVVRLQHGRDHGAGAALALGAGDVDGPELLVRVAQLLEQRPHRSRSKFCGLYRTMRSRS
jgi:hypothetical protein